MTRERCALSVKAFAVVLPASLSLLLLLLLVLFSLASVLMTWTTDSVLSALLLVFMMMTM